MDDHDFNRHSGDGIEMQSFGSKELFHDSVEKNSKGIQESKKESVENPNSGERRGKGMRKKDGQQINTLSGDLGQSNDLSNDIESFEDFISFGTKTDTGHDEPKRSQISEKDDNILSLGLGIEEVADSGESDYRYQYKIISSSEEEEEEDKLPLLTLQPMSTSEDGLFHPESQLFPSDPAAFMRVDFDKNFGEKSSEVIERQETNPKEQETEEKEDQKVSVEVDLSHLPMEHRGKSPAPSPWSPPASTSFLQFGHIPPPRPPSPPPKPPGAPKEPLPSPRDYPHPLPLPKEPLPSATERDGPHIVEVEGRSLPPPSPTTNLPKPSNKDSQTTLTPRTPKLVATPKGDSPLPKRSIQPGESVSRTSYTVTTPASYVFFEQVNVTPSPGHFSSNSIQKTITPGRKKVSSQRKKAFQNSKEKPGKPRKKRPPKRPSPPKRQISKDEEREMMRSTLERQIAQDELYFPNDQDYFPAGGRPSVQRPGNNYNFNHVGTSGPSYTPVNSIGHHQPHKPAVFHPPTPSYHTPTPVHHSPTPTYHTPAPVYHTPEPVYHTPEPSYRPVKPPFTTFNPIPSGNPISFSFPSLPSLPALPSLPFTRTPSPPPRPPRAPTQR